MPNSGSLDVDEIVADLYDAYWRSRGEPDWEQRSEARSAAFSEAERAAVRLAFDALQEAEASYPGVRESTHTRATLAGLPDDVAEGVWRALYARVDAAFAEFEAVVSRTYMPGTVVVIGGRAFRLADDFDDESDACVSEEMTEVL